jgi:hypothetical protein
MMDLTKLPETRMKHYIEKIIATNSQVEPREKEDHANMLIYANDFVMMQAFHSLPENVKRLIEEHMTMREELLNAQTPAGPGQEAPAAPGPEGMMAAGGPPIGLL